MARVRGFGRAPSDRDLDDEVRAFADELAARRRAQGLTPDDATRAARIEIGSVENVKEEMRHANPAYAITTFGRDLAAGTRAVTRSPGFAAVVITTLALGVGSTVMVFSAMHAVVWRPLPYPNADRLVVIDSSFGPVVDAGLAPAEVRELQRVSRTLRHVGTANGAEAFIEIGDDMERVASASVTDDVLALLGATPPAMGRLLSSSADLAGGRVTGVVISDRLWRRLFHANAGIIGQHVNINNLDVEIVGVLPSGLRAWLPASAGVEPDADVWFPAALDADWRNHGAPAIAELASGVSLTQSQAELDGIAARWLTEHASLYADAIGPLALHVRPLRDVVAAPARHGLWVLALSVVFVLVIGCANIANLLLARTTAREREVAIRLALGGTRVRIVRQLVTEHLVLAMGGSVLGLLLARAGIGWIDWLRPGNLPRQADIAIDPWSVAVAFLLSITAVVCCSLVPALRAVRASDTATGGLTSTRATVSARGNRRLQRLLVVAEIALSIAPLFAAGLMLHTFVNQMQAPLGFDPSHVVTAKVGMSWRRYPDAASRWGAYREVLRAVRAVPGVDAVSGVRPLPFEPPAVWRFRRPEDLMAIAATQQSVLPGYLGVTRTPLVAGRDFTDDDITFARDVAIVDETFARTMWDGPAIGRHFLAGPRTLEVVGVTRHVRLTRVLDAARTNVRDEAMPHVFVPYPVRPIEMAFVIRTGTGAADVGPAVKRAVEGLHLTRAVYDIRPLSAYVDASMQDTRFTMLVLAAFATMAVLLVAVGLYGTLAYLVAQRTPELGVRLALGASTRQMVALVAKEGALLALAGTVIGAFGALGISRALRTALYDVAPGDPVTLAGIVVAVVVIAVVATSRPAWQAAHVDPNVALKNE
jgi:predicted permease